MEQTLKVTNVLSDPTRFNIYQHMIEEREQVTVLKIAEEFSIHPNVARLHLSKLEDIKVIQSTFQKTGKGGRPSRLYELSDEVIELNFPHRDYKMLSSIALESFVELGEQGREALYKTGRKYGIKVIEKYHDTKDNLTMEQKIEVLEDAGRMLGMYPKYEFDEKTNSIAFKITNCPFKEVVADNKSMVCSMHNSFLKGMFETLFDEIELIENENMFEGCINCTYIAKLKVV